jgi:hypothetical protein
LKKLNIVLQSTVFGLTELYFTSILDYGVYIKVRRPAIIIFTATKKKNPCFI